MKRRIAAVVVVVAGLAFAMWLYFKRPRELTVSLIGRPVTAFRVDSAVPSSDYEEYVVEQRELGAEAGARVAAVLGNPAHFVGHGARCFSPGLAFRFGSGEDAEHAVICLTCRKVVFRRGEGRLVRGLTDQGLREIRELYEGFFPNASRPTTAATQETR
jgi:hypothetical protein